MKFNGTRTEAKQITVEVKGGIDNYAKTFLTIFNNVKSNRELITVWNNYGNGIEVVCTPNAENAAVDWLKNFGEIEIIRTVEVITLFDELETDYEKYDDIVINPHFD